MLGNGHVRFWRILLLLISTLILEAQGAYGQPVIDYAIRRAYLGPGASEDSLTLWLEFHAAQPDSPFTSATDMMVLFNGTPLVVYRWDDILYGLCLLDKSANCASGDCTVYKIVTGSEGSRDKGKHAHCDTGSSGRCCVEDPEPIPVRRPSIGGTFTVVVDPYDQVAETDETNNAATAEYHAVPILPEAGVIVAALLLAFAALCVIGKTRVESGRIM